MCARARTSVKRLDKPSVRLRHPTSGAGGVWVPADGTRQPPLRDKAMGLTLWDEPGLNGERGEGLPAHMEALSRVHMHLLSASCVPGPVAGAKSKGLTETRLLRGVKGAASRISLFLDSRLQKKCLIRGPTAGMSRAQTPTGARGPCCSRVRQWGPITLPSPLSSAVSTPKDRPLAHTGGRYIMHTHVTHTCSHPHHTRAHSCLRPRMTYLMDIQNTSINNSIALDLQAAVKASAGPGGRIVDRCLSRESSGRPVWTP